MDCKVEFTSKALEDFLRLSRKDQLRIKTELDLFEQVEGMAALHLCLMKKERSIEHNSHKYHPMPIGDYIVALRIVKKALVVCRIIGNDE